MIHVAYMKKSWKMIPKILSGEKTIESRWYKTRRVPWGKIRPGDTVYFKNSGEPVTAKAKIVKVLQFSDLAIKKTREILGKYGTEIGVDDSFFEIVKDKKYCLLLFLAKPKKIKPFLISKKGFGAMTAWITGSSHQLFRFS